MGRLHSGVLIGLLALIACDSSTAPRADISADVGRFDVVPITIPGASWINAIGLTDDGVVVGNAWHGQDTARAFRWKDGMFTYTRPPYDNFIGLASNNRGDVVGVIRLKPTGYAGLIWLAEDSSPKLLLNGSEPLAVNIVPVFINDLREVAVMTEGNQGPSGFWFDGHYQAVPECEPRGLNNQGFELVGPCGDMPGTSRVAESPFRAVSAMNSGRFAGRSCSSEFRPAAINDSNEFVGTVGKSIVWKAAGCAALDPINRFDAFNSRGVVVGFRQDCHDEGENSICTMGSERMVTERGWIDVDSLLERPHGERWFTVVVYRLTDSKRMLALVGLRGVAASGVLSVLRPRP